MRIAIDARYASDHFPGIGRYVYALLRELAGMRHDHELLIMYNPALRNTRFDLAALGHSPQIRLVPTPATPFTIAEQRQIPRLLADQRVDLYHAPYYVMPYMRLPCPAIVTLYDIIPRLFPAETSLSARLLFDLLTRMALRAARHVLTISHSARDDIAAAYGLSPVRMSVTPLAADVRFGQASPSAITAARRAYDLPTPYVLCLSSNKPHKNLPTLVEAWRSVVAPGGERPLLVVAGHFDPRYPEAREHASWLGIERSVRFLADVAEADLPALYAGAELFVFPSRYEGFGLPPLEALACGLPVVCGGGSGLAEVVGEAALVVDVLRPAALAQAITRLLADPALRTQLRERGLRQAQRFSWRHTAELTLAAYEQSAHAS